MKKLKKLDYKWAAIIGLLLFSLGQAIYFNESDKKLRGMINTETDQRIALNDEVDSLQDVTKAFYLEYQEAGGLTVEAVNATIDRLESAIAVYDGNVDIIDKNINNLHERVTAIENYLR